MMSHSPQPTRERVYQFIIRYKADSGGASPSVREMMRALNLSSGAVVHHLTRLQEDGRIIREGYHLSIPGERWSLEASGTLEAVS
jgi:SOS-response transcriptional repressor LexA